MEPKSMALAAFLLLVHLTCGFATTPEHIEAWNKFKVQFGRNYTNQTEEMQHLNGFKAAFDFIKIANNANDSFVMGLNNYSDMDHNQFVSTMLGFNNDDSKPRRFNNQLQAVNAAALPNSVDWRSTRVGPIQDQGLCGSCWTFSSTGAMTGAYAKAYGDHNIVLFSMQQLVDCDTQGSGCNGGTMDVAFDYARNGLTFLQDYPYTSQQGSATGSCLKNGRRGSSMPVAATVTDYSDVPTNEDALKAAVAQGVVSVAIDASQTSFQHYKSGVYSDKHCSSRNVDHAVLAVGYGTDPDQGDYWLIKNSWGTSWGEGGYFRLKRGVNMCGVATMASYPTVSSGSTSMQSTPPYYQMTTTSSYDYPNNDNGGGQGGPTTTRKPSIIDRFINWLFSK